MFKLFCLLLSAIFSLQVFGKDDLEIQFEAYKQIFNKTYSADIHAHKFQIFSKTLERINQVNKNPKSSFSLGLNKFSDLSYDEFIQSLTGFDPKSTWADDQSSNIMITHNEIWLMPKFVDWRNSNKVTGVKNQANCRSSWLYAAVGAIESAYAIHTGNLTTFSEKLLIDCFEKSSCPIGTIHLAFNLIRDHGLAPNDLNLASNPCTININSIDHELTFSIKNYVKINGERDLRQYVANKGPIAVPIFASDNLKNYRRGILNDPLCGSNLPNHAVLIVGYGSTEGVPYWIVKNSWGEEWGEKGYFRLIRNVNMCNIGFETMIPILGSLNQ